MASRSLKKIALQADLVRNLTFSPDTDELTLQRFLRAKRSHRVRQLRFTNCLVLPPNILLGFAETCEYLQELHCVNCVVEPCELFGLVAMKLKRLRQLEWSIHDAHFYASPIGESVAEIATCQKSLELKIKAMYVELVATTTHAYLLELILERCPKLQHLHVHAVRKQTDDEHSNAVCKELMRHRPAGLTTFTYTSEWVPAPGPPAPPVTPGRWKPRPIFRAEGIIWGNICYNLKLQSCSFVSFDDVLQQKVSLRGVQQAIVVVEADSQAPSRLHGATSRPEYWKDVRSLSLVLQPPNGLLFPRGAVALRCYRYPMHLFFKICVSNITELNLTSFHFNCDVDGSFIVGSALPKLRALALAPCGVTNIEALKFLARGCENLEELDIRSERDSNGECPCESCETPLSFFSADFLRLHRRTKLRRLVLDETMKLSSLTLLQECRVVELRLSLDSFPAEISEAPVFYGTLRHLLHSNTRLRSLTLEARTVPLDHRFLASALAELTTLRKLCFLSGATATVDVAVSFVKKMEAMLPLLEMLHLHYMTARPAFRAVTWIRQRDCVWGWLGNGEPQPSAGVFLHHRPCIGCSRSTFIGLAKPHNHD
ncbi:hypothetical protein V5799_034481 [Amblyomma americanum]